MLRIILGCCEFRLFGQLSEAIKVNHSLGVHIFVLYLMGFRFVFCSIGFRVYLFQDGLVRMCTEEYVKPNKQVTVSVCSLQVFFEWIVLSIDCCRTYPCLVCI